MNNLQGNFQPTSLDFINRPNPVEPSDISHRHESSSSKQLESQTNGELLRVLRDSRLHKSSRNVAKELGVSIPPSSKPPHASTAPNATVIPQDGESPTGEGTAYAIPRDIDPARYTLPPPAQQGMKRPRHQVPPVLQGLHQPPPNAGLLPPMDAENRRPAQQTQQQNDKSTAQPGPSQPATQNTSKTVVIKVPASGHRPTRRNKWTDEETHALLQGVRQFGAGNWKKILTCSEYSFNHRTATDLKDRFRVVCSNKDMLMHYQIYAEYMRNPPDLSQAAHLAAAAQSRPGNGPSAISQSADLDLPRAKRRQRTKWSEEEDAALLRGFGRYGPSWTSIQLDPVLKKRTPTDIRDRIRTRFSDQYKKAGLAPKPSKPRAQMRSQPKPPTDSRPSATSLPKLSVVPASQPEQTAQAAAPSSNTNFNISLPPMDDTWFTDVPGAIDSTHPLAHLLNSANDLNSMQALPPLIPRIGSIDHDHHQTGTTAQSIDPLATVLGNSNGHRNTSIGMINN
ncbi:hypothetical protein BDZ85DRAFT_267517 [Elsinoe ampelina]|uniref:Homeodomain-like protein n=1 Tax=Elsinoe ampelina TaxID=302913 RepID=A0A6A6G3F9_9PEZI|nr:hypothetical protein BDZ85DRAFT_267517 [Elsinoe ampelina]